MTKTTWFRVTSLLLCVAMLVAMTTACGGGGNENSGDVSDDGATTTTTGTTRVDVIGGEDDESSDSGLEGDDPTGTSDPTGDSTTVPSGTGGSTSKSSGSTQKTDTPSSGTMNLNGRTITIALFGDSSSKVFTDSAEGIYADSIREVAKKYNCKFRIVTVPILDLIATVEQDAMAGKATYDITLVEGYHVVPKQCVSGYYLCMSDYYDFNDGVWNGSVMEDVGVYEGKRWALPMGFGGDMGVYYNKNLVAAANLKDPWTYVESNTWNFDNFKSFAKALTKDTDGDGQPNQFGFICEQPFPQFVLANGGDVVDMSSGHGKFAMDSAAGKEAMEYVLGLYDEQIIPTVDQISENGLQDAFNAMATGKVAMFTYGAGYGPWLAENAGLDWDEIGWVWLPKGPKAKDYVAATFTQQNMLMVQRYANKPEEVVTVMQDALAFWSKNHKNPMTPEQVREKNATTDAMIDFLQGNHLKMYKESTSRVKCVNILSYTDANMLLLQMLYDIQTKKHTVASGLEAYKSAIQAAITDLETVE